ncbi:three-Cys-motif partner protein TcmP [Rhizobium leguminosarum]|uniref:three-Cys-motif partner protein TcmP n=1 Tax=Rhizobium leguminosarum TaxID=384 RepID=UPI000484B644|nr:three-Cys-motif partner protein TcmP [Rhizobium leguminosarum]WFT88410.1 three-Cys-motif partner protein TcmP [Rhizobium leguminosarum]
MTGVYHLREQTEAKHFILRKYLQTLAFKTLQGGWTLAYIDGFSGPWQSRTPDHSDSSFMIAIEVLKDAQATVRALGKRPRVKCLFVEENAASFAQLHPAVTAHHDPANDFFVETFNGKFENALTQIQRTMASAFALTFIDPTGWTGYEFNKVKPVFEHAPGEVLLNFMFEFVNRFTASSDPKTLASFAGILGPDWQQRLDPLLPREEALMALFTEQFWKAGKFSYVLSTPIEKISDRTHFHIVYGTRSPKGLEAYRQVEYDALKDHGMRRAAAREMIREKKTGQTDLFGAEGAASVAEGSMEAQIASIKHQAKDWLRRQLPTCPQPFSDIWPMMLDKFMLRKTDARDICAELGKSGEIKETWRMNGSRRQKPDDNDQIQRP